MSFNIKEIIFKKTKYRILSIASSIRNIGFFGAPSMTGLYPDSPIIECYAAIYSITIIIIGLSFGAHALTMDKKYILIFSAIYNQATGFIIDIIIYISKWHFLKRLQMMLQYFPKYKLLYDIF